MRVKHTKQYTVSVLMAVYKNDHPEWLRLAIDSVLKQTLPADEIIVVVDGAVPLILKQVIESYGQQIRVLWLKKNQGLWNALNQGLKIAQGELIARMDADDIAMLNRFEKQVRAFEKNPKLDIVGAQIAEFENNVDNIIAYRRVPLDQKSITRFARFRCPKCGGLSSLASN